MHLKKEIERDIETAITWRHDIHAHPEIAFEEERTAEKVAKLLEEFGIDIHRGLAGTGVVGTLCTDETGPRIGLRADLDALPMEELTGLPYASTVAGKMHACGHDGHTAILLAAAKYLAETKNFKGTVRFIFQPAEENVAGGKVMVEDGLFELFDVDEVYALHNMPGLAVGKIAVHDGPVMASADMWSVRIHGDGGHAAHPHKSTDPVVAAAAVTTALQSIVSRALNPLDSGVLSVTMLNAGTSQNIIPDFAEIGGTCRAHTVEVRDRLESRLREVVAGVCAAHGCEFDIEYDRRYPPTINTPEERDKAYKAACKVVGEENVLTDMDPSMGAEDFAWMLQHKPGCYIRLGNGEGDDGGVMVHNSCYDFNDRALVFGASYFAELVEQVLPVGGTMRTEAEN